MLLVQLGVQIVYPEEHLINKQEVFLLITGGASDKRKNQKLVMGGVLIIEMVS